MPFAQDQAFAEDVRAFYGQYRSTFRSESGQVIAQLFERDGWLIAHVSFAPGYEAATVTDAYIGELNRYAKENGFGGKLKVLLS